MTQNNLRTLLDAANPQPRRLVIHGDPSYETARRLAKCRMPRISAEASQQMAEKAKHDAVVNLFVIRPKQSGYASVAEATAAAIKNPDSTAILIEEGESPNDHDDSVIANALADELVKHHDAIFTDVGELADYLDEIDQEETP